MTHPWSVTYDGFDPRSEGLREALCTLGNGFFATRGADAEARADDVHYPGTYVAGLYNRLRTHIAGHTVENEDLVNVPNWLVLRLRIDGGGWFDVASVEILDLHRELDLRRGLLTRRCEFRDSQGRRTTLTQRRLVSMDDMHVAALETTILAHDWSGQVTVLSGIDAGVVNDGVPRYRDLASRHLRVLEAGEVEPDVGGVAPADADTIPAAGDDAPAEPAVPAAEPANPAAGPADTIRLVAETVQSQVRIAEAARATVWGPDGRIPAERRLVRDGDLVAHSLGLEVQAGQPVTVDKAVALYTSRDRAISEPALDAREKVRGLGDFDELLRCHTLAWKRIWARSAVDLDGHERAQYILNLHVFHLAQTVSRHSTDLDVGVPARGLHGEAYRGHIFWDELFILPALTLHEPVLTHAMLQYRFRRLPAAIDNAREQGFRGALYPWQSGSTGREESQRLHLNPRSGRWIPDNSHLQHHINSAVAYNMWHYFEATGDVEYLRVHAAPVLLQIARFWASAATYSRALDRFEILGVMGPDEFHDAYPDSDRPGLDNNAYTNVMAVWVLLRALQVLELLPDADRTELQEQLDLRPDEVQRFEDITRKMRVVFHADGIISQFEGYDALEEFDWHDYRERYGDIHRLDRILEAEDDSANRYKVSKQADVLMLFYLLSAEELTVILTRLGYEFDAERDIPRIVDYYLNRTSHGSTLSQMVHSWVLARADRSRSWRLFLQALEADVSDVQGGTTAEGIHLGALAGTVDLAQRCYGGIVTRDGVLWLDPALPKELARLRFELHYRGHRLRVEVADSTLRVAARPSITPPIAVGHAGEVTTLEAGSALHWSL